MLFVAIFLFILGIVFVFIGVRKSMKSVWQMGIVFFIGSLGTGLITFLALSAIQSV